MLPVMKSLSIDLTHLFVGLRSKEGATVHHFYIVVIPTVAKREFPLSILEYFTAAAVPPSE